MADIIELVGSEPTNTNIERVQTNVKVVNTETIAKQNKHDDLLLTTSKEIVGAINENKTNIDIVSANMEEKADKNDALVYEGVFNGSGDLNTANKINKWYKIDTSAGVLNTPPTTLIPDVSWSAIYVQGNGSGSFLQILYSGGYNKILKRRYFVGSYSAWQEMATTEKADISSTVVNGYTVNTAVGLEALKSGNTCTITGSFLTIGTRTSGTKMASTPFLPKKNSYGYLYSYAQNETRLITAVSINTAGDILVGDGALATLSKPYASIQVIYECA